MSKIHGNTKALTVTALTLLAVFVAAGLGFGFVQTLLVVALTATAVMLTALFAVSLPRGGS